MWTPTTQKAESLKAQRALPYNQYGKYPAPFSAMKRLGKELCPCEASQEP